MDFAARKIYLTNGVGTLDSMIVPQHDRIECHAHYAALPVPSPADCRVNGVIPMRDARDADLHFDLEGGPFEWWRFQSRASDRSGGLGGRTADADQHPGAAL